MEFSGISLVRKPAGDSEKRLLQQSGPSHSVLAERLAGGAIALNVTSIGGHHVH